MGRGTATIGGSRGRSNCNYGLVEAQCPDPDEHCCALTPCCLCIVYTDTSGEIVNAEACRTGNNPYTANIRGQDIELNWEKNAYGVCEFVVVYASVEIARLEKCTAQQCKMPEGEVELENGDVIEWSTLLKARRRPMRGDDVCEEVPCIECECLCGTLCLLWRRDTGTATDIACQYCDATCATVAVELPLDEDCYEGEVIWGPVIFEPDCTDSPGTVSAYVELRESEYDGSCQLALVVDGVEVEVKTLGETPDVTCDNINLGGSFVDDSGCVVTVEVVCKKCGDPCFSDLCGKGCCFTDVDCLSLGHGIDPIPYKIEGLAGKPTIYGTFEVAVETGTGPCGKCGCVADVNTILSFDGQQCLSGMVTPCSREYYFALDCAGYHGDAESTEYQEVEPCGQRLRLLIGSDFLDEFIGPKVTNADTPCANNLNRDNMISLPFDTISCTPEGMQGTIDLTPVVLRECDQAYAATCTNPPNPLEMFSDGCCELFDSNQPFSGAVLTLLPVA
mgnify:CR=1 FL=1